jgi:hypothetical protein
MNSRYKALLPLAAIALIALAGSSAVLAQAQPPARPSAINGPPGPPAFQCERGESTFKAGNGTDDNFAATLDPKPHAAADFSAAAGLAATNIYDQTASNYHFGDSFTLPSGQITKVRLTTRLKPNSGDATNDSIDFFASNPWPGSTPARVGFVINNLPGAATWAPPHAPELFVFDFLPASVVVYGNNVPGTPAASPPYVGSAFFPALDVSKRFDIYVQDDTSVDFVQIELCYKPKYDLVASKKREGSYYTLDVTNAGQPISPSGSIQVVEIVPSGLTITAPPNAPNPWTCTGSFPMVGPDAFTCTYPINAVIPAGQHLPQIVLKVEGKPECRNCMRVHLYLKEVSGGQKPVEEGDMMNNASCSTQ